MREVSRYTSYLLTMRDQLNSAMSTFKPTYLHVDIAAYDASYYAAACWSRETRKRSRALCRHQRERVGLAVRQLSSQPPPQRGHEGDEHPNSHAGEAQRSRQSRLTHRGVRKHENDGEGGHHHGHDHPIRTPDAEGARQVRLAIAQRYARKELEHICDGREEIVDAPKRKEERGSGARL